MISAIARVLLPSSGAAACRIPSVVYGWRGRPIRAVRPTSSARSRKLDFCALKSAPELSCKADIRCEGSQRPQSLQVAYARRISRGGLSI
jgi:hypothetical protein